MKLSDKECIKNILCDWRFLLLIWVIIAVVGILKGSAITNNYLIFKGCFRHLVDQVNLFDFYPDEYYDLNHYGPIFGLIIAPFAALPDKLGAMLWSILMNLTLFVAIYHLPVPWKAKVLIYYIPLHELYICAANCQTNTMISAILLGSLICIRKEKDFWAACFIALGIFVKLYGVVGLCFFFFSKHKIKFTGSLLLWSVIFFVLPMLVSSPEFVVQSYFDWYEALVAKDIENMTSYTQDISVIGMVRRIFNIMELPTTYVVVPGLFLFGLQYLRIKSYDDAVFQLGLLASALLFLVMFSSGSESPTYIIAMMGVAIWFIIQKQPYSKWTIALLLFTILWTWLISSHIFPRSFRVDIVQKHSLKALACFIVWLVVIFQMYTGKGLTKKIETDET